MANDDQNKAMKKESHTIEKLISLHAHHLNVIVDPAIMVAMVSIIVVSTSHV